MWTSWRKLFDAITRMYVTEYEHQLEVLQALGDDENRLKEQIKLGMMQQRPRDLRLFVSPVTGRKAWDE